jgi:hypothetical protein
VGNELRSGSFTVRDPEKVAGILLDRIARSAPHAVDDLDRRRMTKLRFPEQVGVVALIETREASSVREAINLLPGHTPYA